MFKRGKRGQVTLFLILGVAIIAILALVFYLRDIGIGINPKTFLNNELSSIKDGVSKCLDRRGNFVLDVLGQQGGSMNPLRYSRYKGYNVNYLCENIAGQEACASRMFLLSDLEQEINSAMEFELKSCVDFSSYTGKAYELNIGKLVVKSEIGLEGVLIKIVWPIVLRKGEISASVSDFSEEIGIPLGKIYRAVGDILEVESTFGFFEKEGYILMHRNDYFIGIDKPYPDKIYSVGVSYHPYRFQFAVEGESSEK